MAGHWADETSDTEAQAASPGTGGHWADEEPPPNPEASSINQATSASAAAVKEAPSWYESIFSPEFRSGETAKRVRETLGTVFGGDSSEEAYRKLHHMPAAMSAAEFASRINPDAVAALKQVGEQVNQQLLPKEYVQYLPPVLMGRNMQDFARIINPQGPAGWLRTGLEAVGGAEAGLGAGAAGMATPLNIGLAGAVPAGAATKLLAAGFTGQALWNTPGQMERFKAAKTAAEKGEIVGETVMGYLPAAGLLHFKGRAARGAEAEPVGTGEAPATNVLTTEQLKTHAQERLDEINNNPSPTQDDLTEKAFLEQHLAEGGDINKLAAASNIELSDAEAAPQSIEAKLEPAPEEAAPEVAGLPGGNVTPENFMRFMRGYIDKLRDKKDLTPEEVERLKDAMAFSNRELTLSDLAERWGFQLVKKTAAAPAAAPVAEPPATVEGGEWEYAPKEREVTEGGVGEHIGVSPGENVPADTGEVRTVSSEQAGDSGGTEPAEAEQVTTEATVPVMITKAMEAELKARGYSEADINKMKPQEANDILAKPKVEPEAPKSNLPPDLDDAIAASEISAARGEPHPARIALKEARDQLKKAKRLPKKAKDEALSRIAKVQKVVDDMEPNVEQLPPASTAGSADPNVVETGGKTYIRDGEFEGTGIWRSVGPRGRKVGNQTLNETLDRLWEARQALKEEAAKPKPEKKKPAPKTKTSATTEPATGTPSAKAEAPSREETGDRGAQAFPPGSFFDHWDYGEGTVLGPGDKPGTTKVQFKDKSVYDFDDRVVKKRWRAKEAEPAPAAAPEKPAPKKVKAKPTPKETLQQRIAEVKGRLAAKVNEKGEKLTGKQLVELRKGLRTDEVELRKVLKDEQAQAIKDAKKKQAEAPAASPGRSRELERMSWLDRVRKTIFQKGDYLKPEKGGSAKTVPSESHNGLTLYEDDTSSYKPWRVVDQRGILRGHFDNADDAKAFMVRIADHVDFTKPGQLVDRQIRRFGSANLANLVTDPYGYVADMGARIKKRADEAGGFFNRDFKGTEPDLQILNSAREFGQRIYQRGMRFRDWAINMVRHLGEKIMGHLNSIWDSITGRNIMAHARERGGASPGGPGPGAGKVIREFRSSAEAEKFKDENRANAAGGFITQSLPTGIRVSYTPKSAATAPPPVVTPSGKVTLRFNPALANAPPTVNAGNGSTAKPPPPGSALGPTPPGSNPPGVWAQRSVAEWQKAWEKFWPGAYAAFRLERKTPVINIHQKWIASPVEFMLNFWRSPWFQEIRGLTSDQIVDAERVAVTKYRTLIGQGQGQDQAFLNAIAGNPLRTYFIHRNKQQLFEKQAAGILNVDAPGFIDDPYLPRITHRDNQLLVRIGASGEGVVAQLRRSLGHFDHSREYDTMHDGIVNGVQYKDHIEAIMQRERVGQQLIATAQALKDLQDGGVIFKTKAEAAQHSKDGRVTKMEGFGGDNWYIRNGQEARFINQNMNNAGPKGPWGSLQHMINNYARNPNLINPLPHITKNMFFKYILARINNATLKADTAEYRNYTNKQLRAEFEQVFTIPEHAVRMPEVMAYPKTDWFTKVGQAALKINTPSAKLIFEKADPEMRYALWKSYRRKGMDAQEAANHVFFDLIRYDENSGGLNFWKSIPFNFFSTWRTGTYVTMAKAIRTHPIRTLLFFGAVEYMREMIYRKYGKWTHLPIDYLDAPLSEGVEASFKAKKEVALGRNPLRAYADVGLKTAAIAGSAAMFGPGGGQAPDTISDLMKGFQGDTAAWSRLTNMFWGLSQIFQLPQEMAAFARDKKPEHLTSILTGAAFGTHSAIKYEPRRLGKYLPEWLPGLSYTPQMKGYAALREKRESKAIKSASTYEQRHGVTRGWWQGPEEQQVEDLLRGAGVLRTPRR